MLEKQAQKIGNNSSGIQVQGDYVASPSYTDLKAVFMDLFQLNFPKIQEVAANTANERVEKLLEQLKESFDKYKDKIDIKKFEDPFLQYEIQTMTINVARRGEKSNMSLLTELLCTVASNDCPELIELISSEALQIVPLLSKRHLDYLSLQILTNEASMGEQNVQNVNSTLRKSLEHISEAENLTSGDLQYIACTRAIETRGIFQTGIIPIILKKVPELKDKNVKEIIEYCTENNLEYIAKLLELVEVCNIGSYRLMAIGRLIGWLNLSSFSKVDVKKLF
jgi:hypothetical protein